MSGKWNGKRIFHIIVLILVGIALTDLLFLRRGDSEEDGESRFSWKAVLSDQLGREALDVWLPAFSFAGQNEVQNGGLLQDILGQQLPILAYGLEDGSDVDGLQTESGSLREKFLLQEGISEDQESETGDALEMPQTEEGKLRLDEELQKKLQEENQTGVGAGQESMQGEVSGNGMEMVQGETAGEDAFGFVKAQARSQEYDWSYYQDFDALIKGFYAVDATTEASPDQMQLDQLLGRNLTIEKNPDVPQILIYHTHSHRRPFHIPEPHAC